MSIIATERELYEEVWESLETYSHHSPGEKYIPLFLQMIGERRHGLVLDAGCGSGKGAVALEAQGFDVVLCDVTDAGLPEDVKQRFRFEQASLWDDLRGKMARPVDYVYCTDVLEHIPQQFTMLSIHRMLEVGPLFLSVSLVPDNFGVWVGRALHQTVQNFLWWRDSLREIGQVHEARDLISDAVFYVEPK